MFEAMSDAEISCYEAELLPARTVLSMHSAAIEGVLDGNNSGTSGGPGSHGGAGHTHNINLLWWLNQPGTANPDTAGAGSTAAGTVATASHSAGSEVGSAGSDANG
jgi:hypothetical protein